MYRNKVNEPPLELDVGHKIKKFELLLYSSSPLVHRCIGTDGVGRKNSLSGSPLAYLKDIFRSTGQTVMGSEFHVVHIVYGKWASKNTCNIYKAYLFSSFNL